MIALTAALLLVHPSAYQKLSLKVDGLSRTAIVYAPASPEAHPSLILAFHGHFGNGNHFEEVLGLEKKMPNAVTVYLDGLKAMSYVDPKGIGTGWVYPDSNGPGRDVDFTSAVIKWCQSKYHTVPAKTFAVGHSNGGGMVYALWESIPSQFGGFCSLAGSPIPAKGIKVPKAAFILSGSDDPIVKPIYVNYVIRRAEKVNGAAGSGKKTSDGITVYGSGKAPLWVYQWKGEHKVPANGGDLAVKFFESVLTGTSSSGK